MATATKVNHAAARIEARNRLVESNLSLVYQAAWAVKRRVGDHVSLEELVSAGSVGLMEAVGRFDAARGLALSTFVLPRIRGAILDDLRRRDWKPRRVRAQSRQLAEAEQRLEQQHARPARAPEVADALAVDLNGYWQMRDDAQATLMPLEGKTRPDGSEADATEVLADQDQPAVDSAILADERTSQIQAALATLPEREATVLSLTFYEELSGQEIASILGVSESRVSQIKTRALQQLRQLTSLQKVLD